MIRQTLAWIIRILKGPIALVAVGLGAFLIYRSKANRVATLKDALEVEKQRRIVREKTTIVGQLVARSDAKAAEVANVMRDVHEAKRRVVEIESGESLEGKTDEEVAEAFFDLDL